MAEALPGFVSVTDGCLNWEFARDTMMYGPQAALLAELFSTRVRYSEASLGY
jgi:hypothetical protein